MGVIAMKSWDFGSATAADVEGIQICQGCLHSAQGVGCYVDLH